MHGWGPPTRADRELVDTVNASGRHREVGLQGGHGFRGGGRLRQADGFVDGRGGNEDRKNFEECGGTYGAVAGGAESPR